MKASYYSIGQMIAEKWFDKDNVLKAHYKYTYDGQGNIVRSIDMLAQKEYNYEYEEGRILRATEANVVFSSEMVVGKTLVNEIRYSYDAEGTMTKKVVTPVGGAAQTIYYESTDDNTVVKFMVPDPKVDDPDHMRAVLSHSKTDSFGRKVFDELQLGTGFVSRQFQYHAGEVTQEHVENGKLKSTPTTQLVSRITFADDRTIDYQYDAEERITKVIDSLGTTTEYTYDALGQLLTETVNGIVVNTMTYDNYGNILTKNGVTYTYGDSTWKDVLTGVGNETIFTDQQGNPLYYLGHGLTWEKGRQLKTFDDVTFTYNANGIRTSKTVNGVKCTYTLEGTKILQFDAPYVTEPMYDDEDNVCGLRMVGHPYFFQKNLQGDVIGITDWTGKVLVRYSYDAWGACTIVEDTSGFNLGNINPFRYRSYFYDPEIGLYYLQSRYYDPQTGRFVNADNVDFGGLDKLVLRWNTWSYCENEPIGRRDINGCYWYQNYNGFRKTSVGFNLYVNIAFLSRTFCLSYAYDFLRANGVWHWYGRTYSGMNQLRIAQELWFHALVYYIGMPLQKVLKAVGISWEWLNNKVASAHYMEINSNDSRAWVFSLIWWAGFVIKATICRKLSVPYNIISAIVL